MDDWRLDAGPVTERRPLRRRMRQPRGEGRSRHGSVEGRERRLGGARRRSGGPGRRRGTTDPGPAPDRPRAWGDSGAGRCAALERAQADELRRAAATAAPLSEQVPVPPSLGLSLPSSKKNRKPLSFPAPSKKLAANPFFPPL